MVSETWDMVSGALDIVSGRTGHGALGHGAHGTWSLTFRVCWSSMLLVMIGQFRQMVNLILNFPKSIQMNNLYLFENLIMRGF